MVRVMVPIDAIKHFFGDAEESADLVFENPALRRPSDRGVPQHMRDHVGTERSITQQVMDEPYAKRPKMTDRQFAER